MSFPSVPSPSPSQHVILLGSPGIGLTSLLLSLLQHRLESLPSSIFSPIPIVSPENKHGNIPNGLYSLKGQNVTLIFHECICNVSSSSSIPSLLQSLAHSSALSSPIFLFCVDESQPKSLSSLLNTFLQIVSSYVKIPFPSLLISLRCDRLPSYKNQKYLTQTKKSNAKSDSDKDTLVFSDDLLSLSEKINCENIFRCSSMSGEGIEEIIEGILNIWGREKKVKEERKGKGNEKKTQQGGESEDDENQTEEDEEDDDSDGDIAVETEEEREREIPIKLPSLPPPSPPHSENSNFPIDNADPSSHLRDLSHSNMIGKSFLGNSFAHNNWSSLHSPAIMRNDKRKGKTGKERKAKLSSSSMSSFEGQHVSVSGVENDRAGSPVENININEKNTKTVPKSKNPTSPKAKKDKESGEEENENPMGMAAENGNGKFMGGQKKYSQMDSEDNNNNNNNNNQKREKEERKKSIRIGTAPAPKAFTFNLSSEDFTTEEDFRLPSPLTSSTLNVNANRSAAPSSLAELVSESEMQTALSGDSGSGKTKKSLSNDDKKKNCLVM